MPFSWPVKELALCLRSDERQAAVWAPVPLRGPTLSTAAAAARLREARKAAVEAEENNIVEVSYNRLSRSLLLLAVASKVASPFLDSPYYRSRDGLGQHVDHEGKRAIEE